MSQRKMSDRLLPLPTHHLDTFKTRTLPAVTQAASVQLYSLKVWHPPSIHRLLSMIHSGNIIEASTGHLRLALSACRRAV